MAAKPKLEVWKSLAPLQSAAPLCVFNSYAPSPSHINAMPVAFDSVPRLGSR